MGRHGVEGNKPGVKWADSRADQAAPAVDRDSGPNNSDWMKAGDCKPGDTNVFFPSDNSGVIFAQRICGPCPVKTPSLEYALANGIDHGVWGGASERERRRISKRRRIERNLGQQ